MFNFENTNKNLQQDSEELDEKKVLAENSAEKDLDVDMKEIEKASGLESEEILEVYSEMSKDSELAEKEAKEVVMSMPLEATNKGVGGAIRWFKEKFKPTKNKIAALSSALAILMASSAFADGSVNDMENLEGSKNNLENLQKDVGSDSKVKVIGDRAVLSGEKNDLGEQESVSWWEEKDEIEDEYVKAFTGGFKSLSEGETRELFEKIEEYKKVKSDFDNLFEYESFREFINSYDIRPEDGPHKNKTEAIIGYIEKEVEIMRSKLIEHVGSEEYLKKLVAEYNGNEEEAKYVQKRRISLLTSVGVDAYVERGGLMDKITSWTSPTEKADAYYNSLSHEIEVFRDTSQRTFDKYSINKSSFFDAENFHSSIYHELLHAKTKVDKYISNNAKKILSDSLKSEKEIGSIYGTLADHKGLNKYLSNSSERLVRKQILDFELEFLGIKKYGEEFINEHYKEMMKSYEERKFSRGANEFIESTKENPDVYKEIFNNIADTEGDVRNKTELVA